MWDWHWQEPEDYGEAYDYGVVENIPSVIDSFNAYNRYAPTRGWIVPVQRDQALLKKHADLVKEGWFPVSPVIPTPRKYPLPSESTLVFQDPWTALGKTLGGKGETGFLKFTRGTIAACWAIEQAPLGSHIILVGFDHVYLGRTLPKEEAFPEAYREQPSTFPFKSYVSDVVKTGNHDFGIELKVMTHLARQNGVVLELAQDVW